MPAPVAVVEDIVAEVATALAAISGLSVERNRDEPVTRGFPVAVVFDGDIQTDETDTVNVARHTFDLDVELWTQAASGAAAGTAANALYASVAAALQADCTRGGKAFDTKLTGRTFRLDRGEGGKTLVLSVVSFRIEFWTRSGDLTAVAG